MRIISGTAKGRRLQSPRGMGTRPTSDRVREAVFSILAERIHDARVLDLYSGTGAMGLEALSRGASEALFVEKDRKVARILAGNIETCGFEGISTVVTRDVQAFLKSAGDDLQFDVVFADPPYAGAEGSLTLSALSKHVKSLKRSLVVLEHSPENDPEPVPPGMDKVDSRRYGNVTVSFYTFSDQKGLS